MKRKISVIVVILIVLLNIGTNANGIVLTRDSFTLLEKNIKNISEFKENGVKIQYKTKDNIEDEINRVKEYVKYNFGSNYKVLEGNRIEFSNQDFNINIKLWNKNEYTFVEAILINKNIQYTTIYLKKILAQIENHIIEDKQYFLYYKGEKNGNCPRTLREYENLIKDINILSINNGYIGSGYLENGDKINIAIIKYNKNYNIIIGTPIIFTTY